MYDVSSKFNTFYSSHVVLPQENRDELHRKKDLNIQRLKDGLAEYNTENGTSYNIVETCVQGSVAMSTVVQNEDKDYDIRNTYFSSNDRLKPILLQKSNLEIKICRFDTFIFVLIMLVKVNCVIS